MTRFLENFENLVRIAGSMTGSIPVRDGLRQDYLLSSVMIKFLLPGCGGYEVVWPQDTVSAFCQ